MEYIVWTRIASRIAIGDWIHWKRAKNFATSKYTTFFSEY